MKYTFHAILTAAGTTSVNQENILFGVVMSALIVTLAILIIVLVKRNQSGGGTGSGTGGGSAHSAPAPARPAAGGPAPKKPAEEKKGVELMGSLAKPKTVAPPPAAPHGDVRADVRDRKTIDEHYADVHGQWKCPYCETLNGDELSVCIACGQPRG